MLPLIIVVVEPVNYYISNIILYIYLMTCDGIGFATVTDELIVTVVPAAGASCPTAKLLVLSFDDIV